MKAIETTADRTAASECGPWNPGIQSQLTPELSALCTIFRPQNSFTSYAQAVELQDLTGLALSQLVVFRPERLALHEVLIRVIADYEIPDPAMANVSSLGTNFRHMTQTILIGYVAPRLREVVAAYESTRVSIARIVTQELGRAFDSSSSTPLQPRRSVRWWRGPRKRAATPTDDQHWRHDRQIIETWKSRATSSDPLFAPVYDTLISIVAAVEAKHGRLWGDQALLEWLATGLACNILAAREIGRLIEPMIVEAATKESYRPLPAQERSIILSSKGAAASGKSTMRLLQRALADRLGARWSDFALISPDILRRDLLNVDSLGPHYKYFGTFTSHELELIDQKLDRHLANKVEANTTPHLLYDRFRFDSFVPDSEEHRRLLVRYHKLQLLHYVFMITPPHKTVERAWRRGLELGRYKAVDDLLAHNVEAYAGMQQFFLARALQREPMNQHYEFVDNDVPQGESPLTVAFGRNREMNIVDVKCILDFDRYQKIDINARDPQRVYPSPEQMVPEANLSFLTKCVRQFPLLRLAQRETGRIYARLDCGRVMWRDSAACSAISDGETLRALRKVLPELFVGLESQPSNSPEYLDRSRYLTIGRW